MKVGEKTNFGQLATIFQICSMDADILSYGNSLNYTQFTWASFLSQFVKPNLWPL